jgi:uncharacterized protein YqeY
MSRLKDSLRSDLTDAIRSRDQLRADTLRMVLTSVTTEEVAGTEARQLSDDEVLKVVAKEAKKRREASSAYTDAGRAELAAREDAELAVIKAYLPAQLGDEEIEALVAEAVAETGATGMPQLGLVMKTVQPRVAGRADGGRVAAIVRKMLAG